MTISKLRVTCGDCATVFDAELVVDCPIDVAVASMKAVRCVCGSSNCGMGGNYADAPPISAPILDRIRWWLDRGERGTSSDTIHSAFCGGWLRHADAPHDPDDFRRCKLLLDLLPEWRADLAKVVIAYPWLAPMIAQWGEIERLYAAEESRRWKGAHDCYALIRQLDRECSELRRTAK